MSERIHMGNGDASQAECYRLICSLQQVLSMISAHQQFGLHGTEYPEIEADELALHIDHIAADIFTKLTGVKLPFRWRDKFTIIDGRIIIDKNISQV